MMTFVYTKLHNASVNVFTRNIGEEVGLSRKTTRRAQLEKDGVMVAFPFQSNLLIYTRVIDYRNLHPLIQVLCM